jgi:peptidoglycan/LPS O-acetylase OafA/YrhL
LASGRSTLGSDVSAYPLLAGCALAAWMHGRVAASPPRWLPTVALAPLAVFTLVGSDARSVAWIAVPVLTSTAIWVLVQRSESWLAARPLVWTGKRSYALYLWHAPVGLLCAETRGPWLLVTTVGLVISFGLTALSWRCVEAPFLRLKDRRTAASAHPRPTPVGATATVTVS